MMALPPTATTTSGADLQSLMGASSRDSTILFHVTPTGPVATGFAKPQ
jgi:hypothetical protein